MSNAATGGHPDLVFVHLIIALFFALAIRNQKIVPFPFTVSMIVVGAIMGALNHVHALGKEFGDALRTLENIDPHLILIVFLPPLIFESAFSIDTHILRKVFFQPFLLATVVYGNGCSSYCRCLRLILRL